MAFDRSSRSDDENVAATILEGEVARGEPLNSFVDSISHPTH